MELKFSKCMIVREASKNTDEICIFISMHYHSKGFSGGSIGKESACNVGDLGSIPGVGRSPGEGHGYPLQCSCLANPMDRGACQATVHGVPQSDSAERLSAAHYVF
ncbi:unnamed protein product [Rangifer tarandus platyrhynchus]|uniref:Uncharacterized protein n=1 Tax=Rangifer tarandus platyrhynchus TaxID=3082113 RepID=A0ABN8Z839_RANTA|nr:unnamed protein product [Rangifer tarandus platyrhynchus]